MKKTSFGEYFDNQRDKFVKDMQDKNKQQNVEWMERYEERQKAKKYKPLSTEEEQIVRMPWLKEHIIDE
mgnify:FL=1|jgi:hypothetical protein|tara:strand:- start:470 stop:676 length:207 start_codon:yes stop_codon:yes gene_type:complete